MRVITAMFDLQRVSATAFLLGKGETTAQWRAESPLYGCLKFITWEGGG